MFSKGGKTEVKTVGNCALHVYNLGTGTSQGSDCYREIVNYSYQVLVIFEIRKWVIHLHIIAFQITHKDKHIFRTFNMRKIHFNREVF